ncbi:hypothetical protein [Neisseria meningitidis]|uniref:hypothetical protein n=1 Tax=Neisseria meningitidis TaxID=487 RepID=UPI000AC28309|nr:hypothetical protein [Neisseria meningitidis]
MKLRLHLNFENRHNLLCNPFEHSGIKAGGFYILKYSGLTKIRTGRLINKNQDKATKAQTVQMYGTARQRCTGFCLSHYKMPVDWQNPLHQTRQIG